MSTPPPDRPTRPLRRFRQARVVEEPVEPVPVVTERVVTQTVDPAVMLMRLEDAVESLRTWLVIVGILALVALGIALYAAIDDDTARGRGSTSGLASDERVSQIENRVDRLSRQVQNVRSGGGGSSDTSALASRIDSLESTVRSLPSGGSSASGTQAAIDELSSRIDGLASDVQQLKQSQP